MNDPRCLAIHVSKRSTLVSDPCPLLLQVSTRPSVQTSANPEQITTSISPPSPTPTKFVIYLKYLNLNLSLKKFHLLKSERESCRQGNDEDIETRNPYRNESNQIVISKSNMSHQFSTKNVPSYGIFKFSL